jgi:hypothetical protein
MRSIHIDGARLALEKKILHALAGEWRIAITSLPWKLQMQLQAPGFEIRDMQAIWGLWEPLKRNIALSTRLVTGHPWLCVREVLRHEIAHQVACDLFHEPAGHGPRFHEACRLFGADPHASGDLPSIYERLQAEEELAAHDRIMLRVQKLLAVAHSADHHEAETAMAMAHDLIARYNIDILTTGRDRNYASLCVGEPATRHSLADYAASDLLRAFYFVETVWVSAFVPRTGRPGRILEISGTTANIKMAVHVYTFLERTITDQWHEYRAGRRLGARTRADFALGLISGFREKLEAQTRILVHAAPATQALVRQNDSRLHVYLKERYPRLRNIGRRGHMIDPDAHSAGQEAGRRTVLHKPVEHGVGRRGLLLR